MSIYLKSDEAAFLIDISIPNNVNNKHNIKFKFIENIQKYNDLRREAKKSGNYSL